MTETVYMEVPYWSASLRVPGYTEVWLMRFRHADAVGLDPKRTAFQVREMFRTNVNTEADYYKTMGEEFVQRTIQRAEPLVTEQPFLVVQWSRERPGFTRLIMYATMSKPEGTSSTTAPWGEVRAFDAWDRLMRE